MSASKTVVSIGTAAMELSLVYDGKGESDISLLDKPPLTVFGGAGASQTLALAKLGYHALLCALVGEDDNGKNMLRYFAERGVDTRFMHTVKGATTAVVTSLQKEGEREQVFLYPGTVGKMPLALIDDAFLAMPDGLCIRAELPFDILLHSALLANKKQIPVFLDANACRKDFMPEQLPPLAIFSASDSAVEQLTGIAIGGADSCLRAALALTAKINARYFVFRLGERGCFLFDGTMPYHISPYRLAAFDYSRSGDAFAGALAGAYLDSNGNIRYAAECANAAMALCAAKGRAADIYPTKEEIEKLQTHQ